MGLESATYVSQLVATNPLLGDAVSQGDDHLRLIKSTLVATLPNLSGAMNASHTELNYVVGVTSALQTQLNAKQGLDATLTALAGLDATAGILEQTGADAFTKRAFGVGASTSVPTRADADARYLQPSAYTAADVLAKLITVDGAGSGLDADLLDGQSSAFYQSASNLNAGTIPDSRIQVSGVTQHQTSLSIAATQLTGTIPTARLGSFTADNTKFLRGDSTWTLFDLGNIGGTCVAAQVPQACVTQHQAALTIGASQLTGILADARVAQSNVTQHTAAILASAALTGSPTAPTPTVGDNDTSVATTAFVQAAVDALIKGGSVSVGLGASASVTFPSAFATACDGVVVTPDDSAAVNQFAWSVFNVSASGFSIQNQGHNGGTFYWVAKGH